MKKAEPSEMKAACAGVRQAIACIRDQVMPESEKLQCLHRLYAVLFVFQGMSCQLVADATGEHRTTVQRWANRFNEEGLNGLFDRPRAGRPSKLSDEMLAALKQDLDQYPTTLGYGVRTVRWTLKLVAKHIELRYGVHLSVRQCSRIVDAMEPRPAAMLPPN